MTNEDVANTYTCQSLISVELLTFIRVKIHCISKLRLLNLFYINTHFCSLNYPYSDYMVQLATMSSKYIYNTDI